MPSRRAFSPTAALAAAVERLAAANRPRPYIFTQQHRDELPWWQGRWTPQRVPDGARVQVQLPGDPIRWVPVRGDSCSPTRWPGGLGLPAGRVELTGRAIIPNPGRISGTASIYQFDYRVHGPGVVVICLDPSPTPGSPEELGFPPGSPLDYVLTLIVAR